MKFIICRVVNDEVKEMKKDILDDLKDRCKDLFISDVCRISTTLDPSFRELLFCTDSIRAECYKCVKEEVLKRKMNKLILPSTESPQKTLSTESPQKTENRTGLSKYMTKQNQEIPKTLEEASKLYALQIDSEFSLFLRFKFSESAVNEYLDPLLWWNTHKAKFSLLSETAFEYLSIPTCSVGPERKFSAIGRVTQGRYSLRPSTISALVTLKDWYADYPDAPWNTSQKKK